MKRLTDTNAPAVAAEFVRLRTEAGSPAMGMVMTLVVVVDDDHAEDALNAARLASREHPARVLAVILGDGRGTPCVDAEVGVGDQWSGESAVIHLRGAVTAHPESMVLPLLLPDSPVVVWWPADAPEDPAADPIGQLARRRITDSAAATKRRSLVLDELCASYSPGNTDLAWTRLTPWRALLAAALDQHPVRITGGSVTAERISPSADLMVAWLSQNLRVDIDRHRSAGPGLTDVTLETAQGPIRISRPAGSMATFSSPGRPDRPVALARRAVPDLLAEELRHLDEDDIFRGAARWLAERGD